MKNIIKAIEAQEKARLNDFITDLEKINEAQSLDKWFYNELLPKGKSLKESTLQDAKSYLIKRKEKQVFKSIERQVNQVLTIGKAGEFIEARISIEWKKSKMWGSNPSAECVYSYKDTEGNTRTNRVFSGSISGCGYDKQSTAVANCLNQINEILKLLYTIKNEVLDGNYQDKTGEILTGYEPPKNHNLFGYGSGYGITPSIEGGVGVSCYPSIFAKLGYEFKTIASGKTFDVYTITKKA
jgi:hypothetical protein